MKRTLSMITLAAFALMLLGSCSKINERIDNLEKKVDGIENEEIATIESQVQSIESSIIDLKSIRDKVQAMSDPATGLSKRIEDLKAFVNDVKKDYATKDWTKTTLVTMEEYEKTCDTVAKIALRVEGFDSSLKACAESLKGWVNGKFGGYYDIATIDAKLAELQAQVDGVDSLSAELAKTREEIDTAKSAIRAEYRAAITSAIETSEGKLTQALQDSIDSVNATISPLTGRVDNLETKVEALKGRVASLENMIQSVKIIPEYANGSVRVEEDTLYIDCVIAPSAAVEGLTKDKVRILLNKVQTKAVALDTVPTDSIKVFTKDTLNGTVSIKANIAGLIPGNDTSLTVAVNVKVTHSDKLASDITSDFVPVKINPILYLPGVFTVGRGPDGVAGTDDDVKVKFSRGNLRAKKIDGRWDWGFYENQYDWNSLYTNTNEYGNIDSFTGDTEIDHFSWGYGPWSTTPFTDQYVKTHTTEGETLLPSEDWGAAIDDKGTWRTLTIGEWRYLLSYKTTDAGEADGASSIDSSNATRSGLCAKCVTVMGKDNCLILYPDGYDRNNVVEDGNTTAYDAEEEWLAAQAEGVVCLPAAGNQALSGEAPEYYGYVSYSGLDGIYWSSSYHINDEIESGSQSAYVIDFRDESDIDPSVEVFSPVLHAFGSSWNMARNSVRLVTDVK